MRPQAQLFAWPEGFFFVFSTNECSIEHDCSAVDCYWYWLFGLVVFHLGGVDGVKVFEFSFHIGVVKSVGSSDIA